MKINLNIPLPSASNDTVRIHNTIYSNDRIRLEILLKRMNLTFKEFISEILDQVEVQSPLSNPIINKQGKINGKSTTSH